MSLTKKDVWIIKEYAKIEQRVIKISRLVELKKELKDDEMFRETAEELAKKLHYKYEKIAKDVGWKTQTPVEWNKLPQKNKTVMIRLASVLQLQYGTRFLLKIDEVFPNEVLK